VDEPTDTSWLHRITDDLDNNYQHFSLEEEQRRAPRKLFDPEQTRTENFHSYQQCPSQSFLPPSMEHVMKCMLACVKWQSRTSTDVTENAMRQVEHELQSKGITIYMDHY
jgi:hypothetical protein